MIHVTQALCTGCGLCVEACPTDAICLYNGKALIDAALCDDCGACVQACPNEALYRVVEPVAEEMREPSLPAVIEPPLEVVPTGQRHVASWRRVVLPAVGGALSWVGREIVPRLAPLAVDVLDATLERRRRLEPDTRLNQALTPAGDRPRRGRQRRRRRRGE
jgi:NAD-dependent dihydropyrimidine dehydrogenase PreA subunit